MKTIFELGADTGFSLRRCFWLCVPALLLGAVLRISLLSAIPEAFYGSDSNSYFVTARELHLEGKFNLPPKRAYLYPLLLVAMPVVPFCSTVQATAILQHAIGLATIFGIGWITGHLVRRPVIWVPLVTTFAAIWPRMLYYEHEMIGECLTLAFFVAAVAVAAPRDALTDPRKLFLFCLLALAMMATKPAGRPLWAGLLLAAALITRKPFSWPWKCYATIPVAVAVALTTGAENQGPWLFLSSTMPFIRAEGEPHAAERAILRPAIEAARADVPNYAFHQHLYKKMLSGGTQLGEEYIKLSKDKKRFGKVAKTLGREAVLSHPFQYVRLVAIKILSVAGNRHAEMRLAPAKFWSDQADSSDNRWERRPEEMKLLYGVDEPAYNTMVAERAQRSLWFEPYVYQFRRFNWLEANPGPPGQSPIIEMKPLGWLALGGLLLCLLPGRCARNSLLWLPFLLYLVVVYGVGDSVARYLHPLEWLLFVMIAIGADSVLDVFRALRLRLTGKTTDPHTAAT